MVGAISVNETFNITGATGSSFWDEKYVITGSFNELPLLVSLNNDRCIPFTKHFYQALNEINELYKVENPYAIKSYLESNKELSSILINCKYEMDKYFGFQIFKLDLVSDAEDQSWKNLLISLTDISDFENVLENFEKFIAGWYNYQPVQFKKNVTINIL